MNSRYIQSIRVPKLRLKKQVTVAHATFFPPTSFFKTFVHLHLLFFFKDISKYTLYILRAYSVEKPNIFCFPPSPFFSQ